MHTTTSFDMTEKHHLLLVDDDYRIRSLLNKYLVQNGYLVTSVADTTEARKALMLFKFDLIILDVLLPKELGTEFAQELRKVSKVAILMLTAMGTPEERIKGLESGADDYMSKPFDPKELLLRIERIIARTKNNYGHTLLNSEVKLDIKRHTLQINEMIITLNASETKILDFMIENKNHPVSRESLAKLLKINLRSVDVQIKRLRQKIESDIEKPVFLQTVRGKGYALFIDW